LSTFEAKTRKSEEDTGNTSDQEIPPIFLGSSPLGFLPINTGFS